MFLVLILSNSHLNNTLIASAVQISSIATCHIFKVCEPPTAYCSDGQVQMSRLGVLDFGMKFVFKKLPPPIQYKTVIT